MCGLVCVCVCVCVLGAKRRDISCNKAYKGIKWQQLLIEVYMYTYQKVQRRLLEVSGNCKTAWKQRNKTT